MVESYSKAQKALISFRDFSRCPTGDNVRFSIPWQNWRRAIMWPPRKYCVEYLSNTVRCAGLAKPLFLRATSPAYLSSVRVLIITCVYFFVRCRMRVLVYGLKK